MSKRNKGTHGIYDLTCISDKCSRRFKVIWDVRTVGVEQRSIWSEEKKGFLVGTVRYVSLTYPFTGCPFCGTWWCTGPLDGGAYPKREGPSLSVSWEPIVASPIKTFIWIDDKGDELR